MRFKKFEKPHKNAKFQAKRAVMKQDETVKTQIPDHEAVGQVNTQGRQSRGLPAFHISERSFLCWHMRSLCS